MQRFIAIDNVCAWPNLTRMPDGSMIATVFDQPTHGGWEGDAACWASADGGRFWSFRGTATKHTSGENRMNVGAGVAASGDLIVLCSGWTQRPKPGEPAGTPFSESRVVPATVSRSRDGGRTWDIRANAFPPAIKGQGELVPFGDIFPCDDGTLAAGVYSFSLDHKRGSCWLLRSTDDGETWSDLTPVVEDRHVEAAMLHAGGGRWLAAARVFGTLDLDLFASDDDGRTWRPRGPLGIPGLSAAHLLQLADGRILLTYGNRNAGQQGIDIRLSHDFGETWTRPTRLTRLPPTDLGYPAALQNPDGSVTIAYYAGRTDIHERYHMGVILLEAGEL